MNVIKSLFFSVCTTCRPNKSHTVRYVFPFMFVTLTFLGAQAVFTKDATYITVVPSTNSLKAGEALSFDIFVKANKPINAVDMEISFPLDQIKVEGIDVGESVITLWTIEPYVENNIVYLSGGTFRKGFLGEHLIATVNTQAVQTGIATVKVQDYLLLAGDGIGTEVPVKNSNGLATDVYIANENGQFLSQENISTLKGRVVIEVSTDIDGDGEVNLADISRFMSAWILGDRIFDFNADGEMTFRDFGIILSDSFSK